MTCFSLQCAEGLGTQMTCFSSGTRKRWVELRDRTLRYYLTPHDHAPRGTFDLRCQRERERASAGGRERASERGRARESERPCAPCLSVLRLLQVVKPAAGGKAFTTCSKRSTERQGAQGHTAASSHDSATELPRPLTLQQSCNRAETEPPLGLTIAPELQQSRLFA